MIIYFTFKKNQPVPEWALLVTKDGCDDHIIGVAIFSTRGKMSYDTDTGATVMWPAKRCFKCLITINSQHANLEGAPITAKFNNAGNTMFLPDKRKKNTPLSQARRNGYAFYTSLKCDPITDEKPQGCAE